MFVFIEDSEQVIPQKCSLLSFGSLWVDEPALLQVETEIIKLRIKYKCWGELKWQNVDTNHLDMYKEIIDLFCKIEPLKFNSIIIKVPSRSDLENFHDGDLEKLKMKQIFQVVYWNYSRYKGNICFREKINLVADEPYLERGKYKDDLMAFFASPGIFKKAVPIESARKAHSHISGMLQMVDILTGLTLVHCARESFPDDYTIGKRGQSLIDYAIQKHLPLNPVFFGKPLSNVKVNNWFQLPGGKNL